MTLFKNQYRVETARKPGWDYSLPAWYFVTICTQDKTPYFGRVIDEQVDLFLVGEQAERCWREIPDHYENVVLDEFVVMPNHLHGILVIPRDPVRKHDSGGVEGESKQVSGSFSLDCRVIQISSYQMVFARADGVRLATQVPRSNHQG